MGKRQIKAAVAKGGDTPAPAAGRGKTRNTRKPECLRAVQASTQSGIPIKECYRPEDIREMDYARDLGNPGEFPYTRGIYPDMYRGRVWTFRQLSGFGMAKQSNARFKYLLNHGATALSICFDMPTKMGRDSDEEICEGEVGRGGVAVDSLADMETLFDGIPLDQVSTNLVSNAQTGVLLAFYLAVAEKQGIPFDRLHGTTQNDMLKEFLAEKSFIFPPRGALRLSTDIIVYTLQHVPKWNPISICGYHIRAAGSNAVQEIAFCLANATTYVDALLERGLQVDDFAPRLSFFFKAHNDFFEEIAKFRAARRLWARIMRDQYGASNPLSWRVRFHTQTSGSALTTQQPENNIVRIAIQALAAVLGGTQSLHINSYDEALCLPSEKAARIAIRTHQIIAYESGVPATVDPLGGSYYVESLTNEIERRVQEYLGKIKERGGAIACIEQGYLQREIARAASEYQQQIEKRERIIVGVNDFVVEEPEPPAMFQVDEREEKRQRRQVKRLRAHRDNPAAERCLQRLREAARGTDNLMPPILEAVKSYATMGEITGALADVWGRYRERSVF